MARDQVVLLNKEMNRALTLPDVKEKLDSWGLEIHTESPEYFGMVIKRDIEKWGKVARDMGFQPK
jgi:tripartite-type tricarboxylate transporter receptor subunit TctC